jgi:hypothetical protein
VYYRRTHYFALYDKDGLIAVTTYRKGARALQDRLESQDKRIEELQAWFNALAAADLVPSLLDTVPASSRNGGASHHEDREPLWFPL